LESVLQEEACEGEKKGVPCEAARVAARGNTVGRKPDRCSRRPAR